MKKLILKKNYSNFLKIVLIIVIIISLGNVAYRKYEEYILQKEINSLMKKDLVKDSFNPPNKTIGKYAVIESSIKKYLEDYSNNVKKVLVIINDDKLKSMLSAANYQNDGPKFTNTSLYLKTIKENFNLELTNLIKLTKKETILSYTENTNLNKYYKKIYRKYMLDKSVKKELETSIEHLKQSSDNINRLIDKEQEVINFLINCNTWIVKEDKIIFSKEEDLTTYNNLINQITS